MCVCVPLNKSSYYSLYYLHQYHNFRYSDLSFPFFDHYPSCLGSPPHTHTYPLPILVPIKVSLEWRVISKAGLCNRDVLFWPWKLMYTLMLFVPCKKIWEFLWWVFSLSGGNSLFSVWFWNVPRGPASMS